MRTTAIMLLAGSLLMAAACQTTVTMSDGRPPAPKPKSLPLAPSHAKANAVAATVGIKTLDSDGNGFPDMIPVQTFLLSSEHPGPIYEPGAFVFELHPYGQGISDAGRLAQWRVDGAALDQARFVSPLYGPGYAFRLSLLETGGDQYPLLSANLSCRFEPADGRGAIRSPEAIGIQIGKRMSSGDGTTLGP